MIKNTSLLLKDNITEISLYLKGSKVKCKRLCASFLKIKKPQEIILEACYNNKTLVYPAKASLILFKASVNKASLVA